MVGTASLEVVKRHSGRISWVSACPDRTCPKPSETVAPKLPGVLRGRYDSRKKKRMTVTAVIWRVCSVRLLNQVPQKRSTSKPKSQLCRRYVSISTTVDRSRLSRSQDWILPIRDSIYAAALYLLSVSSMFQTVKTLQWSGSIVLLSSPYASGHYR